MSECGYDAGDCGDKNLFSLLRLEANYSTKVERYSLKMKQGETVAAWNVSEAFRQFDEVGVELNSTTTTKKLVRYVLQYSHTLQTDAESSENVNPLCYVYLADP